MIGITRDMFGQTENIPSLIHITWIGCWNCIARNGNTEEEYRDVGKKTTGCIWHIQYETHGIDGQ